MTRKLFFALAIILTCSVANAEQTMPQTWWWDIWAVYKYESTGPENKLEQRREKWGAMNEAQRQAAISQFRPEWLKMSFAQRKKAAEDAWAWERAHKVDVPVQHAPLIPDR
jgi:hypothetical protein